MHACFKKLVSPGDKEERGAGKREGRREGKKRGREGEKERGKEEKGRRKAGRKRRGGKKGGREGEHMARGSAATALRSIKISCPTHAPVDGSSITPNQHFQSALPISTRAR